jgi:hypothetical protein
MLARSMDDRRIVHPLLVTDLRTVQPAYRTPRHRIKIAQGQGHSRVSCVRHQTETGRPDHEGVPSSRQLCLSKDQAWTS